MKPISKTLPRISKPTGRTETAETKPTSIGPARGKRGYAGKVPAPQRVEDRIMASLPRGLVRYLAWSAERDASGTEVLPIFNPPPPEETAKAIGILETHSAPLPPDQTIRLLTKIRLMTAQRPGEPVDQEAQLVVYAEELVKWPADVVKFVLETQAKQSKWWPAWAEIEERLELWGGRRRKLRAQLEDLRAGCTVPP